MRLGRAAALWTAVLLAAGFVVLRVVYRIVFGGVDGSGVVLADLPRIPLGGPFEHISLFGPVTTGGLRSAAISALPFAGCVLAVGVIAALVDLRGLLERAARRGPIRSLARSLVIAWSTLPALVQSVRQVRVARELRGERSASALLVPVLERTIERAIALGSSMEVRGFAASRPASPTSTVPVRIRRAALGYGDPPLLESIELTSGPGTLTLITGSTGSGKSTLLHALSGLFQHIGDGQQFGRIEVAGVDRAAFPPRDTASFVGVVSQSVRLSFVGQTVREELRFGLAGGDEGPVAERVIEVAERLGIRSLLDREAAQLSAGEACLVAIGAAVVRQPRLLLVDEPLADLDTAARERVVSLLDGLAHRDGVCILVTEHAPHDWGDRVDVRLHLANGRLSSPARLAAAPRDWARPAHTIQAGSAAPVAQIAEVSVRHGEHLAVDGVSMSLHPGDVVALIGPNGAGKSSLLHAIARPRSPGLVFVGDRDVRQLRPRARRELVALVPEQFDDLLFTTTVRHECRRADPPRGPGATADHLARLLGGSGGGDITGLMDRHPRDLSAGQRLCLVLAIQLSARPRVLLVDEPTRGMDAQARAMIGRVLGETAATGTAVVFATHDLGFAAQCATRTITMSSGRVLSPAGVPG